MEKVASLIREEVSVLFAREFSDSSYGFMTVTDVRMTADLKIARVYVSIMGNVKTREQSMKLLEEHKPAIRHNVGAHLRLKFTPEIHFFLDDTMDRVERIETLIKEIHKPRNTDDNR